jgi:hypothetical protein
MARVAIFMLISLSGMLVLGVTMIRNWLDK